MSTNNRGLGPRGRSLARTLFGTLCASTALCSALPAFAQDVTPDRPANDPHLVDVNAGVATSFTEEIRIGDVSFNPAWTGKVFHNSSLAYIAGAGSNRTVFIHGVSKKFTNPSGTTYVAADADGSTLILSGSTYTYTTADGSVYVFTSLVNAPDKPNLPAAKAWLQTLTRPDGKVYTYHYALDYEPSCGHTCFDFVYVRTQSITTSDGYMLKLGYASPTYGTDFYRITSAQTINRSVDYCDPNANSCTGLTQTWPSETIAASTSGGTTTTTITDADSDVTTVSTGANGVASIDQPGSTGGDVAITYDGSNRVSTITQDGATYSYGYTDSGNNRTTVVTAPDSSTTTYVTDIPSSRVTSVTDAVGKTTTHTYDGSGRETRVTAPEGNYVNITYDARGNVTEVRQVAKSGSGLSDIVQTASYDSTCANIVKCNKPNYTIDANGNRTDFTYDSTHGGLTRIQLPASASGQPRAEIDYTYTSMYAQEKNSGGTLVNVGSPQYKVTQITTCATAATCAGTANETKTTLAYNTPNLLPTSKTVAAGDASISATETYTYDINGNLATVDGPLSGTDDTTYYFYGLKNQLIGVIGPDPDGAGSRKRRAEHYIYNPRFMQLLRTDIGSVSGTTLSDLWGMTVDQQIQNTYDANSNVTKTTVGSGGTTYQVVQYSYDSRNRLECTALRMNPAVFGSLPGSACTAGTAGSSGPDRITKNSYDAADRLTLTKTAYGSGVQADAVTSTYTDNGALATVTDGEGNKTTYEYDGLDRLSKTRYPSTTKGAGTSSTTDYEQLVYDANSNVTSRRLRGYAGDSTKHIDYSYDYLNRITAKDLPGSEPDVSYTYDLLNRMTGASQTGNALTFGFDALGRNTSQDGPLGSVTYQYDAAGRRTRVTWPDSFYATYDYLVTGEVAAVRENGATSGVGVLATYAYDDLGRLTSLTRGNGTVTSYTFDNVSRLASIAQNLSGTTYDATTSFAYAPSGQIASQTRTNDNYAWGGHYNVARSYGSNGLNQFTTSGATSLSYDARGNLSNSGSDTYGYSSENLLTSAPGSVTLAYDPALRLYQTVGGSTTKFQYDGANMIGEYNSSGTLQKRYVFGPGTDEPLVEYAGTGTSSRTFLHADERGSIVARSDSSGNETALNSYDEYGIPASGNVGRFQYTGQTWLPEIGMYYYKARIYSPSLGRFMQTDPIGYADGLNWYNYVKSDPVNHTDPTGKSCHTWYSVSFEYYDHNNNNIFDRGDTGVSGSLTNTPFEICSSNSAVAQRQGGGGGGGGGGKGHDYRVSVAVCKRALTVSEARDLISRFTVPNKWAGWVHNEGYYIVDFQGYPGGIVYTSYSNNGMSGRNVTTPLHAFVGTVDQTISVSGGETYINTHGYGSAGRDYLGRSRDAINEVGGTVTFALLDAQASLYAQANYKGCRLT